MLTTDRRYDIDFVRVIAIGLLLIYHVAIGFQSWGMMIAFVTNKEPWGSLWIPMAMLNVWRIPLLFFVSGMGVYFAMRNRSWKQLVKERAGRIFIPYVAGIFLIVPLHLYVWYDYYNMPMNYSPNPGHLWFLGNIFAYVLIMLPLFYYLKNNEDGKVARTLKMIFCNPLGLFVVGGAFVAEVLIVKPFPFEMYAMTWHGFFLGLLAFFFGFCFVLAGEPFWKMLLTWRWLFLAIAVGMFIFRITAFQIAPAYLMAIESVSWIVSVFAFGYRYLNRPSKTLRYLSEAAYPVYILHMIFLYLASVLIFPLDMAVQLKFFIVLILTALGCFVVYEFIIRRVNVIRFLFGLKMKENNVELGSVAG